MEGGSTMATIDKQVVDMQFNNKQFEDGVSQTLSTLDKLKNKLNFGGSAQSLKELEKTGQNFDMNAMQAAIENISNRFSTMGIMGMQVLQNIANTAYNTGKRMVSALTIDPIKTGFQEYETQMNAVQTILANTSSKGSTLKDVNAALGELNTYADKTIYNFTEMTRNIGTFTAAGVELDTSVQAIKGIANLAAVSGSTSQQASTAMYQLSQALSSGTVKLQDWNSVVNAGMGGQVFQDALKETARLHGVNIDKMIKEEGSFRETLSEGWLTSSILTETLNKFTGDLTEDQLKSMGYTQEQAKEIVKMGVMANDAATKVKTFTQLIDTMKEASQSGWTQSWEIIIGDFEEAKALLTDISDEAGSWIGQSADNRNKMLKDWKELGGRTELISNLWTGWYGIAEIINTIGRAWSDVFPPTTGAQLKGITDSLSIITNAIFDLTEKYGDQLYRTFKGFFSLLDIGRMVIVEVARVIGSMIKAVLPVGGGFLNVTANVGDTITAFRDFIKESGFLTAIGDTLVGVFANIGTSLKKVGEVIKSTIDKVFKPKIDNKAGVGEKIDKEYVAPLTRVKDFLTNIAKHIQTSLAIISPVVSKITEVIFKFTNGVTSAFIGMDGAFNFSAVATIINGVLVGGVLKAIKGFVEGLSEVTESFGGIAENISNIFDGVRGSLEAYQSNLKADSLKKIAVAVALLAGSLFVLSTIKAGDMAVGLAGMAGLLAGLVLTMKALNKVSTASTLDTAKMTVTMISIASSIAILAVALKLLSTIDAESMGVAIVGVMTLLGSLVGTVKLLGSMGGKMTKGMTGLIGLASALVIISGAVKILGGMDPLELLAGVVAVTSLLGALSAFILVAGNTKGMVSVGVGLTAVAVALNILSGAVAKIGGLPLNTLTKGILGVATVLISTAAAMRLMPKDMISKGTGMVILASSIVILSDAIGKFGAMSKKELIKGMTALASSMVILVTAMNLMKGGLAGAAALVVMTGAIGLLVPILGALGGMAVGDIIKSLATLAATLTILGIAGAVLTPVVPTLLGLGAAVLLLGGGVALAAAGITLLAGSITLLSAALVASGTGISVFVASIISLLPAIATGLAKGLIDFIKVLTGNVKAIYDLIKAIVVGALDVLIATVPKFIQTGVAIITALLAGIRQVVPNVINTAFYVITQFLNTVRNNIVKITTIAVDIIVRFVNTLSANLPRIIDAAFKFVISFINGLATAIRNNSKAIGNAAYNLISALVTAIRNAITSFGSRLISDATKIGGNIVTGIRKGITSGVTSVVNAAKNLATSAMNGVKNLLGIRSPSRVMMQIGKWTGEGFVNGIANMGGAVLDTARDLASGAYDGMAGITKDVTSIFDDLDVTAPVITPVLDLSEVTSGMKDVDGLMSDVNGINVATTANLASSANPGRFNTTNDSKSDPSTNEGNVTFVQNNYSPKELSDYDIWRQTQQLLKTVKVK